MRPGYRPLSADRSGSSVRCTCSISQAHSAMAPPFLAFRFDRPHEIRAGSLGRTNFRPTRETARCSPGFAFPLEPPPKTLA